MCQITALLQVLFPQMWLLPSSILTIIMCHTLCTTFPNPVIHPKILTKMLSCCLSPCLEPTGATGMESSPRDKGLSMKLPGKPTFLSSTEIYSLLALFLGPLRLRQSFHPGFLCLTHQNKSKQYSANKPPQ